MENIMSIKKVIKNLKTSDFVLNCKMPMGYSAGYPILQIHNEHLCMMIPYLKFKSTGIVDKTLVYPVRFTVTVELPEIKPVKFVDLKYEPSFGKIDFSKPIGYFRHEAIKKYGKKEYFTLQNELNSCYDKLIAYLLYDSDYSEQDEQHMKSLLRLLIEPSQLPIYRMLDQDFYLKFLSERLTQRGEI